MVHYEFAVPGESAEPLTVEVKLQYRKFDTIYMNYVFGTDYVKGAPLPVTNDLPITDHCGGQDHVPGRGRTPGSRQLSTLNARLSTFPSGSAGTITASACSSKATGAARKAN